MMVLEMVVTIMMIMIINMLKVFRFNEDDNVKNRKRDKQNGHHNPLHR